MTPLAWFGILQLADLLTTVLVLKWGGAELNPLARMLMQLAGVIGGLALAKAIALSVACFLARRGGLGKANAFYSALILWNVIVIIACLGERT